MNYPDDVTYRRATPSDAGILADAEKRFFSDPWSRRAFEGILNNPGAYFVIAETGHCTGDSFENDSGCARTLAGYGGMTVAADECDIINVAVDEKFRRRGIGRRIMQILLDEARSRGAADAYLEHRLSNIPAAALYEGMGFEILAVRKNYYTSPKEDAVIRRLTLDRQI